MTKVLTYPSARLKLGMSAVGAITVLSFIALWFQFPQLLSTKLQTFGFAQWMAFPLLAFLYISAMAPIDILGGFILPQKNGKKAHSRISVYIKGALIHGILVLSSWLILHFATMTFGIGGTLITTISFIIVGLSIQFKLSGFVGSLKISKTKNYEPNITAREELIVSSYDSTFSGSIVGIPGHEKVILPSVWVNEMGEAGLKVMSDRRKYVIESGLRNRGLFLASAWLISSILLSILIIGLPDGSVSWTLNLIFCTTIFHFVGLLVLPTPSRNATYLVDEVMNQANENKETYLSWLRDFSRLTDGEENRNIWVERIFHPLPSVQNRIGLRPNSWAAWNATRTMLYLSIFCGGLLSRAVHCNAGRPDLWIIAPTD